MTVLATAADVGVEDLVGLFAGDEHSAGYPCAALAIRICELTRPRDQAALRRAIYGDWPPDMIPHEARVAVNLGFTAWQLNGKPTV